MYLTEFKSEKIMNKDDMLFFLKKGGVEGKEQRVKQDGWLDRHPNEKIWNKRIDKLLELC